MLFPQPVGGQPEVPSDVGHADLIDPSGPQEVPGLARRLPFLSGVRVGIRAGLREILLVEPSFPKVS